MSALSLSPAVMINRIIQREGDAALPHLAKVAKLRMDLMVAAEKEQARQDQLSPEGEAKPVDVSSGAAIDRLI